MRLVLLLLLLVLLYQTWKILHTDPHPPATHKSCSCIIHSIWNSISCINLPVNVMEAVWTLLELDAASLAAEESGA